MAYIPYMATASRTPSNGRFSISGNGKGSPTTVRDSASGKVLDLKGYGALSGEYAVRTGIDLSKPIAEQAAKITKKTIAPPKPA
jgi:hypothetical protein